MTLPTERQLPRLFVCLLLIMLAVAGWQWHRGTYLQVTPSVENVEAVENIARALHPELFAAGAP